MIEALGGDPCPSASAAAQAAAVQEAAIWQANAGAWMDRLARQYSAYLDIVQPVQLAVHELRHGLSLLSAAAALSPCGGGGDVGQLPPRVQDLALVPHAPAAAFPLALADR